MGRWSAEIKLNLLFLFSSITWVSLLLLISTVPFPSSLLQFHLPKTPLHLSWAAFSLYFRDRSSNPALSRLPANAQMRKQNLIEYLWKTEAAFSGTFSCNLRIMNVQVIYYIIIEYSVLLVNSILPRLSK